MTNREKYKDELIKFRAVSFDMTDGKVKDCSTINCEYCRFWDYNTDCTELYKKWLNEEYIERKRETSEQNAKAMELFSQYGYCYFVKNECGSIFAFKKEPHKVPCAGYWYAQDGKDACFLKMPCDDFDFLFWDDEKAYYFDGEQNA